MDKVTVIILNYNTWEDTVNESKMICEVLNVDYNDIIIVDNASSNESYDKLLDYNKELNYKLLKSEKNKGYASGNNIGLRYAFNEGYDYALICNNDIIIDDKELINKLIFPFKKDNSIATSNPDIYSSSGHLYNRDAKKPSFWDLTFGMCGYIKKGRQIEDLGGYGYVYRPQGCCMMLDLKKINEIDYLDENTFLYYEENILAERLLKKNYKCVCVTCCKIIHNHSKTVRKCHKYLKLIKIKQFSFLYYLNCYRQFGFIIKYLCMLCNLLKELLIIGR